MSGIELAPCPFCGSMATVEQPSQYFAVECSECFCEGPSGADAAEAVRHWNTRSQSERVSRLEEALNEIEEALDCECDSHHGFTCAACRVRGIVSAALNQDSSNG